VSLEGFLQRQMSKEQAVPGPPPRHQLSGDFPILPGPAAPMFYLFFDIDHRFDSIGDYRKVKCYFLSRNAQALANPPALRATPFDKGG
jgi:hypothetical protein